MSTPYGMPPTPPAGGPPVPPPKSRTPLYIALACGCALLLVLALVGVGVGVLVLGQDGEEEPTRSPSTSSDATDPSSSPAEDPTTGIETDQPIDKPTEGPEPESTTSAGDSLSLTVSAPQEGATLTKSDDETVESENGKFVGVAVTITNKGSEDIGLSSENFRFYDADGQQHRVVYGSFSTSGPRVTPDEEATAQLYADVPADMELTEISYTDDVGTAGSEVRLPVG